jgi:hypothetical protein
MDSAVAVHHLICTSEALFTFGRIKCTAMKKSKHARHQNVRVSINIKLSAREYVKTCFYSKTHIRNDCRREGAGREVPSARQSLGHMHAPGESTRSYPRACDCDRLPDSRVRVRTARNPRIARVYIYMRLPSSSRRRSNYISLTVKCRTKIIVGYTLAKT